MNFKIEAQSLERALLEFSQQADIQVVLNAEVMGRVRTPPLKGFFSARTGLQELLKGTGYSYASIGAGTVSVMRATSLDAQATALASNRFWQRFRLRALPAEKGGSTGDTNAIRAEASPEGVNGEDLLVTAQKQSERRLDVPVPVTAIDAQSLIASNQVRLQDYYTLAPGLSVVPDDYGAPLVAIRSLTTGPYLNPTVGIVVDDVPFGGSSASVNAQEAPDLDPNDLAQIEVLRGPQGTLYGTNSIGGLLKYVTVDPTTDRLSGRLRVGASTVHNGASLGYSTRGAVNLPVGERFAIRASGFVRRDPGYIDDPVLDQKGVNSSHADGARLSALWRPSDSLSLKISALVQHTKSNGSAYADRQPDLGDLQQRRLADSGWFDSKLQGYSAILKTRIGRVNLDAVSGYNVNGSAQSFDFSDSTGLLNDFVFGDLCRPCGAPVTNSQTVSKFTQEIRLSAPFGSSAEWLLGAFYNHERAPLVADFFATIPATGAVVGNGWHIDAVTTFSERAAFADLTFHLSRQFDVQIGGRYSHFDHSMRNTSYGLFLPRLFNSPSPLVYPKASATDSSSTHLLTARFKVSADLMVYARIASGFQAGGPNLLLTPAVPVSYRNSTTENYEIGIKGRARNGALSFDASVFHIDWRHIQLYVGSTSGLFYYTNGGSAKSQGIELAMESEPLDGLHIAGWLAGGTAKLTESFPSLASLHGLTGDRLPYGSRLSASLSLDLDFPLPYGASGFIGATTSYVGGRKGAFVESPQRQRQHLPAYAEADLRAGVKYESWTVNLYVNNALDKRALLNGGLGTSIPYAFQYIQPRTVGIALGKAFQ